MAGNTHKGWVPDTDPRYKAGLLVSGGGFGAAGAEGVETAGGDFLTKRGFKFGPTEIVETPQTPPHLQRFCG